MEQSIEVGSIWIDKSGENPVIVLAHNKQRQSVSFTYLLTINGKLDLTEAFSSVDLFLKTKELMVTSSSANTEYVKGKTYGYGEGYQHGFTLAKEKITELDELDSNRIYNDGYVKGHNDGWRGAVKAYSFGKSDNEVVDKLDKKYKEGYKDGHNDCSEELHSYMSEKELVANNEGYEEGFDEGYNTAIKEMSNNQALGETTEYEFGTEDCCEHHNPNKETQEVMQEVLGRNNRKYSHYYKDVRHLDYIDVYQVNKLFPVKDDTDCILHARKKLLVCGGRGGGKDMLKDITEAYDTLKRYLEIEGHLDD